MNRPEHGHEQARDVCYYTAKYSGRRGVRARAREERYAYRGSLGTNEGTPEEEVFSFSKFKYESRQSHDRFGTLVSRHTSCHTSPPPPFALLPPLFFLSSLAGRHQREMESMREGERARERLREEAGTKPACDRGAAKRHEKKTRTRMS